MDDTCARAVEMGLPAIAFTEHVDNTPFRAGYLVDNFGDLVSDGILTAPKLDVAGYLDCVERCRAKYRNLRILTGMEVGQPHRHHDEVADLLATGTFDRVIGSLHCLTDGGEFAEPFDLIARRPADTMFRDYLTEIPHMVAESPLFTVLAHIDYPVRSWPADAKPFHPVGARGQQTPSRSTRLTSRTSFGRRSAPWRQPSECWRSIPSSRSIPRFSRGGARRVVRG